MPRATHRREGRAGSPTAEAKSLATSRSDAPPLVGAQAAGDPTSATMIPTPTNAATFCTLRVARVTRDDGGTGVSETAVEPSRCAASKSPKTRQLGYRADA